MKKFILAGIACFLFLPAAESATTFRQVRIPFSDWPRNIDDFAVVDLNKDGIADVVTLEGTWAGNPSILKVFMGDRSAAFSRKYTKDCGYFNLKAPIAATGDLTGDKRADVVVKGYDDCFVIFPGKGNGALLSLIAVTPTGSGIPSPTHWTGGFDLDGDNKLDLAGFNSNGSMSAFRNLGNKKFAGSNFGQGDKITSIAGGDINKDGSDDVVGGSGSTLRFFKSNGDGTFGQPVISKLGENAGPHLEAADINGDGRLDLIGDSRTAGRPGWAMLGKANGTFGNKKTLPTKPSLHYGFVVVDFTKDGKRDVAAPGSKAGIDLFRGLGNGGFAAEGRLGGALNFAGNTGSASSGRNLAYGDVNGDGKIDLVALVQFPGDSFMTPAVLVFLNGVAPVSPSISNLEIDTLYYDGDVHVAGQVDFNHPGQDVRNSGWMANDGAFVEYTVGIDFGAQGKRSKKIRTGTNHPGETQGTIYFNITISDNTWPSGTPTLSVSSFSLYDFHFVQSNVLQ